MDGSIDIITLISLVVAVVAILKLRSVLGRRTGDEEGRMERYRREATAPSDNVVTLPRREPDEVVAPSPTETTTAEAVERIQAVAGGNERLQQGLMAILKADPNFEPNHFLTGAKQAYEMIVTSFAEGNRRMLKDLLSSEVYEGFVSAIADRESRQDQVDQSFVGIEKANIIEADVRDGMAHITVKFMSQLISATRDRSGAITSGDPQRVMDVTDIWTFMRDVSSPRALANPNWKLAATQAAN